MKNRFDHENLRVYTEAINFVFWVNIFLDRIPKRLAIDSAESFLRTSQAILSIHHARFLRKT